jgi:hypothetical protein
LTDARSEAPRAPGRFLNSQVLFRTSCRRRFQSLTSMSFGSPYGRIAHTDLAHLPISPELSFRR